jgi:hypothetical protein
MIDYTKILVAHYSSSHWTLDGDSYDGLTWYSKTPKPTKEELESLWGSTQAAENAKQQSAEAAKQSGMAKLAAIGLTPDEIKSLLGV